jgi:hypothetical protein
LPKDTNGPCTSNNKELSDETQQLRGNKIMLVDGKINSNYQIYNANGKMETIFKKVIT